MGWGEGEGGAGDGVKEGWGPLCEFLGKSIPEGEDFPRKDGWAAYKNEHGTGTS